MMSGTSSSRRLIRGLPGSILAISVVSPIISPSLSVSSSTTAKKSSSSASWLYSERTVVIALLMEVEDEEVVRQGIEKSAPQSFISSCHLHPAESHLLVGMLDRDCNEIRDGLCSWF